MKIAIYSFSKVGGAGGVAANNAEILKNAGLDCSFFFRNSHSLWQKPQDDLGPAFLAALDNLVIKQPKKSSFLSLARSKPRLYAQIKNFDIIHLHWWQGLDLKKLRADNPSARFVFSLHDDRAFTGGCHSAGNCKKFVSGCSDCPIVRQSFTNLIATEFIRTRTDFEALAGNVSFVAPSQWMRARAAEAGIEAFGNLAHVPNPISGTFFSAISKNLRVGIGNNQRAHKFGFVAQNLSDRNKRLSLAIDIVDRLNSQGLQVLLEIVGSGTVSSSSPNIRSVGPLGQDELVSIARDWTALVSTSEFENAPMVIAEMALIGIPTISTGSFGAASMLQELGLPVFSELTTNYGAASKSPSTEQVVAFIESWDESKSAKLSAKAKEIYSNEAILSKLLILYSSS